MPTHDITHHLHRWTRGEPRAVEDLVPLVYRELHTIAEAYARRERPDHTLQSTAVVHEAFLKLFSGEPPAIDWENRSHFLGIAARVMRQVLVDHSRRKGADKRGGDARRTTLPPEPTSEALRPVGLDDLDTALKALEAVAPDEARVVELRFFGGLTLEETAECTGVSRKTVVRRWRRARAWLRTQLEADPGAESDPGGREPGGAVGP
ncbi:MAG: ECF-type sigma factor [Acidobacteriota bacterium]|jgi:RNA polymerase sigma factor (TIGR02999 family)